MTNWKTTLGGMLYAGGVLAAQALPPQYSIFGQAAQAVSVLWLGYHAADKG